MAFQNKNLSVIAYANGFTLWHYASATETMATISASGYFNNVKSLMNIGDIVIANASDSTAFRKITAVAPAVTVAAI